MILTHEYITKHQTENGGYTRAQLSALGVSWPPVKGWKAALVGSEITAEQARQFERGKEIFS